MIIKINQSNKIEKTDKDTIIGLANSISFTVLVKRKIKRRLQEDFRREGKPRVFVYRTFIASIVLLIKYANLKNITKIIIDLEYFGQDKILKSMLLEMWSKFFTEIPEISFERVGKKSKVHDVCYFTMKGKYKVSKVLDYDEIKRLVLR